MEKSTKWRIDPRIAALKYIDHCIAMNEDVQDRLEEGCGLFALVSRNQSGKMSVEVTAISPENLGGNRVWN